MPPPDLLDRQRAEPHHVARDHLVAVGELDPQPPRGGRAAPPPLRLGRRDQWTKRLDAARRLAVRRQRGANHRWALQGLDVVNPIGREAPSGRSPDGNVRRVRGDRPVRRAVRGPARGPGHGPYPPPSGHSAPLSGRGSASLTGSNRSFPRSSGATCTTASPGPRTNRSYGWTRKSRRHCVEASPRSLPSTSLRESSTYTRGARSRSSLSNLTRSMARWRFLSCRSSGVSSLS